MTYVRLAYAGGGWESLVPAIPFGIWAVHRCPHVPSNPDAIGWRITHVPSGRSTALLADGMGFREACRVAAMLADRMPDVTADASAEDRGIIEATFAEALA